MFYKRAIIFACFEMKENSVLCMWGKERRERKEGSCLVVGKLE